MSRQRESASKENTGRPAIIPWDDDPTTPSNEVSRGAFSLKLLTVIDSLKLQLYSLPHLGCGPQSSLFNSSSWSEVLVPTSGRAVVYAAKCQEASVREARRHFRFVGKEELGER